MTVKMEDGRGVIRLGDKTDHGGEVVQVAHDVLDMGKPIACKGDMVKCPKCKGAFPIEEGEGTWLIDGVPAAFHGHKTKCGAKLISSWGGKGGVVSQGAAPSYNSVPLNENNSSANLHDEFFLLKDKLTNKPIVNQEFCIITGKGQVVNGVTDNSGKTSIVITENSPQELIVYLVK